MTREHEIFLEALEQPSNEARAAFVERVTVGDPKLREAVEALLENNQADTFLEQGPAELLRVPSVDVRNAENSRNPAKSALRAALPEDGQAGGVRINWCCQVRAPRHSSRATSGWLP
jgi:hypothetical protein